MRQTELSAVAAGYQMFQAALLDGRLRPGQFVSQKDLGAMLNLSVGALREILPRLQSERLLLVQPKRGIQIPVVDLPMIRDAFQLRAALEREAVVQAVRKVEDAVLEEQRDRHEEILAQLAQSDGHHVPVDGQKVDEDLHSLLMNATENELLMQAHHLNTIRMRMIRLDRIKLTRITLPSAFADHLAIIDAILMRDKHRAIDAMDLHVANARDRAMEL
ncbi:GntR family transcriptional regulator [Sulfitobacter pacificus]|uniref:GntR family transcriptional regulator n=1 Tax=Sulfitobacter pacificus TaxID=1499314 RepID=UPI003605EC2D